MEELPHIPIVDSPNRFYQVVYEEDVFSYFKYY